MRSHLERAFPWIVAVLAAMSGCRRERTRRQPPVEPGVRPATDHRETRGRQPSARAEARPKADPEALRNLGRGIARFSLELYGKVAREKGNVFFSPWSVSMALAMARLGARGETASEMTRVLHLPARGADEAFAALRRELTRLGPKGPAIEIANRIFPSVQFPVLPSYTRALSHFYATEVQALDFGDPKRAAGTINSWIRERTNQRIRRLVDPGDVGPGTRVVLANTIFFKGRWAHPFPKGATRKAPFHAARDRTVQVDTMFAVLDAGYRSLPDLQVLALPYAGGRLSMVVLLPRDRDGLSALERKLNPEFLASAAGNLPTTRVAVYLPRFQAGQRVRLESALQALGMRRAFSREADFSGITSQRTGIQLSAVIHEANCDVDEEGTVAAAATALVAKGTGAPPAPPPTFRADHPFVFFVRDERSGAILFMGRLVEP